MKTHTCNTKNSSKKKKTQNERRIKTWDSKSKRSEEWNKKQIKPESPTPCPHSLASRPEPSPHPTRTHILCGRHQVQHRVRGAAHQIAQIIVRRSLQHGVNRAGQEGEQLRVCVGELGAQLMLVCGVKESERVCGDGRINGLIGV